MGAAGRRPHRARRRRAARRSMCTTGAPIEIGPIEKMSKSKKNTVDPDDIIATYGADTARWFMLSDSPPERDVIWTEEGVQGAARFVQRVWRLVGEIAERSATATRRRTAAPARTRRKRSPFARPRTGARRGRGGRRAPALQPLRGAYLRARQRLQALLARDARTQPEPELGAGVPRGGRDLRAASRPDDAASCGGMLAGARRARASSPRRPGRSLDRSLLVEDAITLPVQVNGKKRADVTVARDADQAAIEAAVLSLDAVRRATEGAPGAQDHRRSAEDRECRRLNSSPAAASRLAAVALARSARLGLLAPALRPDRVRRAARGRARRDRRRAGRDEPQAASASAIICAASWSSISTARASRRRSATS